MPVNPHEKLYAIVGTFFGTAVFAYFIAEVSAIFEETNISSIRFHEKKQSVEEFMRVHSIPKAMRIEIRKYYQQSWSKSVMFDSKTIMNELSPSLAYQLSVTFKKRLVAKVPFLEGADDEMIHMVVARLTERSYKPGDVIIEKGDTGTDMYGFYYSL